jgi:hypothetical protein
LGSKSEELSEVINKAITSKLKSVREWEERQQMVDGKVRQLKEGHRKNNTNFWVGG